MIAEYCKSLAAYKDKTVIIIGLLGFVAAIPFPLVFGTLSLWCREEGLTYATIGIIGMIKLPYALRFLWAPLIDGYKIPFFSEYLGHRKSWLLFVQISLMIAIMSMAWTSPGQNIKFTAIAALFVAFCSASQDIIIDVLRIELLPKVKQGYGVAAYIFGYRIGMLMSGAGAILFSSRIGWHYTYSIMAILISVGIISSLCLSEKQCQSESRKNWFLHSVKEPVTDFINRNGWYIIIAFLIFYKLNNSTIATFSNSFYRDCGFSKDEIAFVVKIYGLIATLIGGFLGGIIVAKFKMRYCLFYAGVFEGFTSLAFAFLSAKGHNIPLLISVISFDNLVGAIGSVILTVYLSNMCNRSYTATQYALFNSLLAFSRDFIAANTGFVLDSIGFFHFFIINAFLVIPSLILIKWLPNPDNYQTDNKN